MIKIGVIVGSLRKESYNRKIAEQVIAQLPDGYEGKIIDISKLPIYNEDIDGDNPPKAYVDYRNELEKYDAWIFATPEYNRSFSGAIKNAIDVGSRPAGENRWGGKPGAVISASPGTYGGFGANNQLRQPLSLLNVPILPQPEVYMGDVMDNFDDDGKPTERTIKFLQKFVDAYIDFIDHFVK